MKNGPGWKMYVLLKMGICPRENWDLPLLCYSTRRYLVVCRERGSELGNTCSEENYRQVPGSVHLIEQTTRLWFQPVKNNLRSTWAYSPNILKNTAISWDDGPVYHMHGGKALAVHQITSDSNGIHASKTRNGENMVCFKCVSGQATKQRGNIKIWKFPKCSCKPQVPVQNESVMYSRSQHFSSFS